MKVKIFLILFFSVKFLNSQCNNYSVSLNGSSSITVPDNVTLRPSNLTISMYIKTNSNNMQSLVNKVDTASGNYLQYGLSMNHTAFSPLATYICSSVHNNPGCVSGLGMKIVKYQNGYASQNVWQNIVFTYDGNYQYLYLNGNLIASTNAGSGAIQNCVGGQLLIGKYISSSPYFFSGKIDEVALYNRALSSTEIQNKYQTALNTTVETGLIAYYRFEEGNGTTVEDLSGNNNRGYLTNCTWSTDVPFTPLASTCVPTCTNCKVSGLPLNDSLQLCMPFNSNIFDESGKSNVTSSTAISFTNDRHNYSSRAINFNGSSSLVNVTNNSNLSYNAGSIFSICFWVNAANSNTYTTMLTKSEQSDTSGYLIGFDNSGRIRFLSNLLYPVTSNSVLPLNKWNQICVTFNTKNDIKLYINGVLDKSGSVPNLNTNLYNIVLGKLCVITGGYNFTGKLDDLRIYRRVLSASDISNLYYTKERATINVANDTSYCAGKTLVIGTSGSSNRFLWSTGDTTANLQVTLLSDTSFWVRGQLNENTCYSFDTINFKVFPNPTVVASNDTTICSGQVISLKVNSNADKIVWNTGDTTRSIQVQPYTNANYWVRGNFTGQQCYVYDYINVNVNPLPIIKLSNDTSICFGNSLKLNSNGNATRFLWSNGDTTSSINVIIYKDTTFGIRGEIGNSGCYSFDTIKVKSIPFPIVNAGNDTSVCFGNLIQLRASGTANRFLWNTGDTNSIITYNVNSDKTFIVRGQIGNSTCYTYDTIKVNMIPLPIIFTKNDTAICNGDSLELTTTGNATNYLWSTGATSTKIIVKPSSTQLYWVRGQLNNQSCYSFDSVTINVKSKPTKPFITKNGNTLISSSTTNNQWFLNGLPINGAVNMLYLATSSGLYSVKTKINECESDMSDLFSFVYTGINDLQFENTKLFPNPTKGILTITNSKSEAISFFDISGKLMFSLIPDESKDTILDITSYQPGIYFLKINYKDKVSSVFRIVKE